MKFGIVSFPGSNCDDDAVFAATETLGQPAVKLWHKSHDLEGSDVIILPGGFSYGDYMRAGAIARFSPIMREVAAHAIQLMGPKAGVKDGLADPLAVGQLHQLRWIGPRAPELLQGGIEGHAAQGIPV